MSHTSTLILERRERPGGGGKTAREFLDMRVDSVRLIDRIGWEGADLVTPLGWGTASSQLQALRELRRDEAASLPSGRVLLYVCPECGDIGCGAIAVRISRSGDHIVWDDFARENGYDEPSLIPNEPIYFDASAYWHAFDGCAANGPSNKSLKRKRGE
jgi:hypothetical protein